MLDTQNGIMASSPEFISTPTEVVASDSGYEGFEESIKNVQECGYNTRH